MRSADDAERPGDEGLPPACADADQLRRRVASLDEEVARLRQALDDVTHQYAESELRFRMLADAAPVLLWMADADGRGTFFNQAWLDFRGATLDGERATAWDAMIHPEDYAAAQGVFECAVASRRAFELELRLLHNDGTYRWVLDKGVPRFTPSGEFMGFIGSCTDITEFKAIEQELRRRTTDLQRANARLHELDRLKTAFMSNVSHEFRTPLTSIQGFAEFLEDEVGGPLTEDQRHFVDEVLDGARRLRGMIDDLLDFAQLNAGTLTLVQQEIDLAPAIEEAVSQIKPHASARRLELGMVLPQGPLVVWADEGRIRQVILNLLSNAVKFTPEGGRIVVTTQVRGAEVHVAVTDTGIGIAPDHLGHMFERFYQVDTSYTRTAGGAGLGLSLSKALVEAHGGRMGVTSQLGEGSTFWFTLPLSRPVQAGGAELRITIMPEQDIAEFTRGE